MPKTNAERIVDALDRCLSEMRGNPALWTSHTREFAEQVTNTKLVIIGGGGKNRIAIKLKTVAAIIVEMHKSSVNRKGRMLACDALVQLDTFSWTACNRHAANAYRLEEILAQDAKDRGVRTPKRAVVETRSPVFA